MLSVPIETEDRRGSQHFFSNCRVMQFVFSVEILAFLQNYQKILQNRENLRCFSSAVYELTKTNLNFT